MPKPEAKEFFTKDPITAFGIVEAKRHRERGVSLSMFMGLMKYYRQAYIDLIKKVVSDENKKQHDLLFINSVFDRIEIGFCVDWTGSGNNKAVREMQLNNRLMTNEKNKYLTIFESIPNPIIILNHGKQIDNMNISAARLFKKPRY